MPSQVKELTLFHTNDLHSHLKQNKTDPFQLGGLARTSTLLKKLRSQSEVSITLDGGDWSEGTWYYDIDQGANMLKLLSIMKYDAAALGNHDFLQGPDELVKTLTNAQATFPILAANLNMSEFARASELEKLIAPTLVKTVNGIRIGIIGLTTYDITFMSYMKPVQITDFLTVAIKKAIELRPNVDVLILLSHNAFKFNEKLAQVVPVLDAVISGHSHVKTTEPVMVSNLGRKIPVVETDSWGSYLGELKISVDLATHVATFKNYQLHPISPDIAEDPEILNYIAEQDKALTNKTNLKLDEIETETTEAVLPSNSGESPLGNLTAQAYRMQTGADLALEDMNFASVELPKGKITTQDIHDVLPHIYNAALNKDWTLKVWNAKGTDLFIVLSTFYAASGLMPFGSPLGWLTADNAEITWNLTGKLPVIHSLKINQKAFNPLARYSVVMSGGVLRALTEANEKLKLGLDLSQLSETGFEAWRSLLNHIRTIGQIDFNTIGSGKRVKTTTPDLSAQYYEFNWDKNKLSLTIHNNGLSNSQAAKVNCFSGVANKSLLYKAYPKDLETWALIGSVDITPLAPGAMAIVEMPWESYRLEKGFIPTRCEIETTGDLFISNNNVEKVFEN